MQKSARVGKGTFLEASMIMTGLSEGVVLQQHQRDILRSVAGAIHDADAWRKFVEGTAACTVDEEARETYMLVRRGIGSVGGNDQLNSLWASARNAACTMCSLVDGGSAKKEMLTAAAGLCWRVGMGTDRTVDVSHQRSRTPNAH